MAIQSKKKEDEDGDGVDDKNNIFYNEEHKNDSIWKKIARFFASFFGLFLILAAYTLLGALFFYKSEVVLEQERYDAMVVQDSNITDSIEYTVNYLTDLHFSPRWTYNNCTRLVTDKFYVKNGTYFSACTQSDPLVAKSKFCRCVKLYKNRFENDAEQLMRNMISQVVTACNSYKYRLDENGNYTWTWAWTFQSGFLFTMTTLATIGYGNIAPTTVDNQLICVVYTLVGLGIMMIFLANIGDLMGNALKYIFSRICCRWCRVRRKRSEFLVDNSTKVSLKDDPVGEEEYMPTQEISVPIIVTLCVMFAYIVSGAVIYTVWEGWTLTDATYFSFITLSTIGFGDFVPGQNDIDHDISSVLKLLFTSIYCLLGLALISMGISLMQEQIMAKAAWFAKEVGISGSEEDNMTKYILTKHYNIMVTPAESLIRKRAPREVSVEVEPILVAPADEEEEESEEEETEEEEEEEEVPEPVKGVEKAKPKKEKDEDEESTDNEYEDNLVKKGARNDDDDD